MKMKKEESFLNIRNEFNTMRRKKRIQKLPGNLIKKAITNQKQKQLMMSMRRLLQKNT